MTQLQTLGNRKELSKGILLIPALITLTGCPTTTVVTPPPQQTQSVLTYHNDLMRTGQNNYETTLTRTNVNNSTFGKLAALPVDGLVYAQPLYAQNVSINGTTHNVLIVATQHDSVYAFDADTLSSTPLWQRSFLGDADLACTSCTTLTAQEVNAPNIEPEIGITATPTIDITKGIIYVVAATNEAGTVFVKLHALQLTTGKEELGGPIKIEPSLPGSGPGSDASGMIPFDPLRQLSRSGLALANGTVYVAFSSYNDQEPAHGWLIAYNATNLNYQSAWMTTPNSGDGNIWMSGDGPAVDSNNNVFFATGNGDPTSLSSVDYADSVMKIGFQKGELELLDYFKPFNWLQLSAGGVDASGFNLSAGDVDLGSGGVMLLPDQTGKYPHLMLAGGKEGTVYLLNRDNMGQLNSNANATADTQIVQYLPQFVPGGKNSGNGIYSTPAYFNGTVFMASSGDYLRSIPMSNGLLNTSAMTKAKELIARRGSTPSISSNGTQNGIVWTLDSSAYTYAWNAQVYQVLTNGPTILRAYSTDNLSSPLYSSNTLSTDAAGNGIKFGVPTVAGGKVFVGTQTEISVYGLKSPFDVMHAPLVGLRTPASVAQGTLFQRIGAFFAQTWTWIKHFF